MTTTTPRYPNIEVQLTGEDGNAYNLLGIVQRAMRRANVPETECKEFIDAAMSGDYNHLLRTCMDWVSVS